MIVLAVAKIHTVVAVCVFGWHGFANPTCILVHVLVHVGFSTLAGSPCSSEIGMVLLPFSMPQFTSLLNQQKHPDERSLEIRMHFTERLVGVAESATNHEVIGEPEILDGKAVWVG